MYKVYFAALLLLALFSACSDDGDYDSYTIGDNFLQTQTTVAIIDTFKVSLSSFMVDSLVTSNTSVGLVGNYKDDELGIVRTNSFYQLGISSEGYPYEENAENILDSLTIRMRYSGVTYGDTTKTQTINVYRIAETFEEPDDRDFYNVSSLKHEQEPIGTETFEPEPLKDQYLEIRLSDAWGQELLDMIRDDSKDLDTNDDFFDYLPGIVLESETDDGAVLSVAVSDTSVYMTIYAHRVLFEKEDIKYTFPLTNSNIQFNHIESDRTGTNSELIDDDDERNDISSVHTGNHSFIQAGTGIYTRIEFPGLSNVLTMAEKRILLKAELILTPAFQSYLDYYTLPENLYLYESNRTNLNKGVIVNSKGESVTAKAVIDYTYYRNTYYSFDITNFISDELSDGYYDVHHAILVNIANNKSMGSTLDRVIFSDDSDRKYRPILKLYYVFYE
jgi:hypothetical protein